MVDSTNLVRALRHFAVIPDAQMARLLGGTKVVAAAKGAILQRQDEPADWLGFLEHGVVRAFRNLDGREVTVGFEVDGGFTGAFDAYMQRRVAMCNLQAVQPSRVWQFPRPLLDGLLAGHPCWRELSGRIAEAELSRKIAQEFAARTRTPAENYVELVQKDSPLVRNVPQYLLASWLGIAPETLSRIRARLAVGGAVGTGSSRTRS